MRKCFSKTVRWYLNGYKLTLIAFILNEICFYIVQYGDDHPQELEALWTALVQCWPTNIRVVMHYLVIMINMAATELLAHVSCDTLM